MAHILRNQSVAAAARISVGLLLAIALYVSSTYSYLLFHSLAEMFSIVIAFGTFVVVWNTRRQLPGNYLFVLGVAYLFISHDISTVRRVCDDVLVLYKGSCVEQGRCDEVIDAPRHEYTRTLIRSIPQLRTDWRDGQPVANNRGSAVGPR